MIKNAGNFVEAYYHYENNLSTYSNSTLDSDDQPERNRMNSSPTLVSLRKQSNSIYHPFSDLQTKQISYSTASTNPTSFNTTITNSNFISQSNNDTKGLNLNNKLEDSNDGQQSPDANSNGKKSTDTTKYKTELCNTYNLTGYCDYGNKCRFAHGRDELQKKPTTNNNLFRTKLCKAFHEKMYCPYGQRCHFLHEIRTVIQIQSKRVYQKKLNLDTHLLQKASQTTTTTTTSNTTNSKQSSRLPIFNYICSSNNLFQTSTSKSNGDNQTNIRFSHKESNQYTKNY